MKYSSALVYFIASWAPWASLPLYSLLAPKRTGLASLTSAVEAIIILVIVSLVVGVWGLRRLISEYKAGDVKVVTMVSCAWGQVPLIILIGIVLFG